MPKKNAGTKARNKANPKTKVQWDEHASAAENASRELPRIVSEYFAHGREIVAGPRNPRTLHSLRLASKKLRYTLELFRPCYPSGIEERIDELKKLQDWLGAANDAAATGRLLRSSLKRHPEIREFLDKRASAQAAGFTRYWKRTFDAKGQESWWTDFLSTKSRPPKIAEIGKPA